MTARVLDTRHGRQIVFDTDRYHWPLLEKYGDYNYAEADVFRHFIPAGGVAVDAGAHIGCHTLAMSQLAGPGGLVLAFEPQRPPYYALCGSLALNAAWNVVAHNAALGDRVGVIAVPYADYERPDQNFGGLSIGALSSETILAYDVPIVRLDAFNLPRLNFLKVDVQGMEEEVVCGARETILRCRPFLYVEDENEHRSASLREAIVGLGYNLYLHRAPLTQPDDNFHGFREDILPGIITPMLFGVPREVKLACNLEPVSVVAEAA